MKENSIPTAIAFDGVTKRFRLPHERHSMLKERIFAAWRMQYEEFVALTAVSLSIKEGSFVGLIGPNGSGKSTLLKMSAGVYRPDEGTVSVRGTLAPFLELSVGFEPELSGRDNVFLYGALLGLSHQTILERYADIVEFSGIERFMDQKVKNYSSGMLARLGFSVSLFADADILLVDEVLAVGDGDFQHKCFFAFEELKRRGKTVVFVSHDLSVIERFADRVVLLYNGAVVLEDRPSPVLKLYREKLSL